MNITTLTGIAILAAWLALAGQARAADFFVSPQGNDAWSGKLAEPNATKSDGPLATIEHAQQLVRRLPGNDKRRTPIRRRHPRRPTSSPSRSDFGPEDSARPGPRRVPELRTGKNGQSSAAA